MDLSVIGYGIVALGACFGIAVSAYSAATSTARQPEMQPNLFTIFILGAAFCEALGLIGFVLALMK